MYRFSLQFLGKEVETQYRDMLFKTTCKTIKRNFSLLSLISLVWMIRNIIRDHVFHTSVAVPMGLFIMLTLITLTFKKVPKLLDYILFIFQLGINLTWIVCYFLHLHKGYFETMNSYYLGYLISYITQWYHFILKLSYNVGSRTYLKVIAIQINTIQMIIVMSIDYSFFNFTVVLLITSGTMCIYHIHQDDRCRREAYLIQIQQEKWEQNLDEVAEIALIQCTFDKRNNCLILHKANKVSTQQFQINGQMSFRDFTSNISLTVPRNLNSIKEQKINLGQLLFYMFTDVEQLSPMVNSFKYDNKYGSSSLQAKGIYQLTNYKVQLFSFWKTEKITVISISKFEDNLQIKTMKCKLRVCQMAIKSYQQHIQSSVVPAIILMKKLKFLQEKTEQLPPILKQMFTKLFDQSEYQLYETYRRNLNLLIFFRPRIQLQCQLFQPAKAIKNAIDVLKYMIDKKSFRIITEKAPVQLQIYSCYQLFHQLIVNILEQIMEVSDGHEDIYLLHQPGIIDNKKQLQEFVVFTISTKATSTIQLFKNQIWVLNPLSLKNCERVCQNHNSMNINLCVAHHIVSLLGPLSVIEYSQEDTMCTITFKIYQQHHNIQSIQRRLGSDLNSTDVPRKFTKQTPKTSYSRRTVIDQDISNRNFSSINESIVPSIKTSPRQSLLKYNIRKDLSQFE